MREALAAGVEGKRHLEPKIPHSGHIHLGLVHEIKRFMKTLGNCLTARETIKMLTNCLVKNIFNIACNSFFEHGSHFRRTCRIVEILMPLMRTSSHLRTLRLFLRYLQGKPPLHSGMQECKTNGVANLVARQNMAKISPCTIGHRVRPFSQYEDPEETEFSAAEQIILQLRKVKLGRH
jgi:hypothetical protein